MLPQIEFGSSFHRRGTTQEKSFLPRGESGTSHRSFTDHSERERRCSGGRVPCQWPLCVHALVAWPCFKEQQGAVWKTEWHALFLADWRPDVLLHFGPFAEVPLCILAALPKADTVALLYWGLRVVTPYIALDKSVLQKDLMLLIWSLMAIHHQISSRILILAG